MQDLSPKPGDLDPIETASRDELAALQLERLQWTLRHAYDNVGFYRTSFDRHGVHPDDCRTLADLARFPFTAKNDLRDNYPFGMFAVPTERVARIHASSGTTGQATVVGYTSRDIDTWAEVVARSIRASGGRAGDKVHVAYGYGLFTGGLGAHYGAEKLGCTVIPVSGGMTERQVTLIQDFRPDIIMVTPSYMLALLDEFDRRGIDATKTSLKVGVFGAEPWTDVMRHEIEARLDMHAVDIYGLSEVMGPGVAQRVHDLRVEVVLPDVQAVLGLHALVGDAGSHHLRQPVDVDRVHVQPRLDLVAHDIGPRLRAEDSDLERGLSGVDAAAGELIQQRQHVRRGNHDDVRPEVLDQRDLSLGHAAGHWNDRAAQLLRAVVRAQPPGEQAVAIGHVHLVPRSPTRRPDRPGHHLGPGVNVAAGVPDDGGPAGRPAGGMDPSHPLGRYGEHPERVVVAKVVLRGERKARQVGQSPAVVGMDAGGGEGLPVERHVVVGMPQRPAQPFQLQRRQLVPGGRLDGIQIPGLGAQVLHGGLPVRRAGDLLSTLDDSGSFQEQCNALTDPDAHSAQGTASPAGLQLNCRGQGESGAAHAERVPERDGAAVGVDMLGVIGQPELPQYGE